MRHEASSIDCEAPHLQAACGTHVRRSFLPYADDNNCKQTSHHVPGANLIANSADVLLEELLRGLR